MTFVLIGKGLVLGGLTFKNRGHLGSMYIIPDLSTASDELLRPPKWSPHWVRRPECLSGDAWAFQRVENDGSFFEETPTTGGSDT